MVDSISKEHRSWNMSRIKSANTKPELIVRSVLHRMGFRFRLNGKVSRRFHPKGVLPGKPDIVLAGFKTVIFVNGCFWHMHKGCKESTIPKTRTEWWLNKLNGNVVRDKEKQRVLEEMGWKVIVVWECETDAKKLDKLVVRLEKELS